MRCHWQVVLLGQQVQMASIVRIAATVRVFVFSLFAELHDHRCVLKTCACAQAELAHLQAAQPVVILLGPRAIPEARHDAQETLAALVVSFIFLRERNACFLPHTMALLQDDDFVETGENM